MNSPLLTLSVKHTDFSDDNGNGNGDGDNVDNSNNNDVDIIPNGLAMFEINLNSINGDQEMLFIQN